MSTTITNAGITKKTLLIGVSLGYVYSLPKMFLDPRRNLSDSPKLREEGLIPYIPELPLITTSFINYNQTGKYCKLLCNCSIKTAEIFYGRYYC